MFSLEASLFRQCEELDNRCRRQVGCVFCSGEYAGNGRLEGWFYTRIVRSRYRTKVEGDGKGTGRWTGARPSSENCHEATRLRTLDAT